MGAYNTSLTLEFEITDSVMTQEELMINYMFGIDIEDRSGGQLPPSTYDFYLQAAQEEIEKYFSIKFLPQVIDEREDYVRDDYVSWGFIKTTYPIKAAHSLKGFVNDVKQIDYPDEWLSTSGTNDPQSVSWRQLSIVPVSTQTPQHSAVYSGVVPLAGWMGLKSIPNYWEVVYTTGFGQCGGDVIVPMDLKKVIGMWAAMGLWDIGGNLVLGAGIANLSLSIDSLSSSVGTTSSAENHAYSASIKSYQSQLKESFPRLADNYLGVRFGVV